MSKSCENQIVLWKFGGFEWNMPFMNRILKVMDGIAGNRTNNRNVPIETFAAQTAFLHLPDSQEWFNKFAIDPFNEFIACGNRSGEVHIWRLRKEEFDFPSKNRFLFCLLFVFIHHYYYEFDHRIESRIRFVPICQICPDTIPIRRFVPIRYAAGVVGTVSSYRQFENRFPISIS